MGRSVREGKQKMVRVEASGDDCIKKRVDPSRKIVGLFLFFLGCFHCFDVVSRTYRRTNGRG